ncbi:hypothetical protein [Pseudoduganella umbonata]|uniref:Uncharacterized protein n=1 Tax=Pseudoduganella umbonata TaxID=864828 RepID=A0A7W5HAW7_9BURK|nr:hypothetical protein [Pseudoduganella umbonata]MBB3219913.1 hypothetical protein [Pseudoduganella umbonata]
MRHSAIGGFWARQLPSSTYQLCQSSFSEFQAEVAPRGVLCA